LLLLSRISATVSIALLLLAAPLRAQPGGAHVTLRAGIASAADAYQSNCGQSSLAFGVDVQGKARFFPHAALEHFTGAGGTDVLCLPVAPASGTAVGGLRLEGATRFGFGVGSRTARRAVQLEGVLVGGLVSGRNGFFDGVGDGPRRVRPQVGGHAALVVGRVVVLSTAIHWTRLTLDTVSPTGDAARVRTEWSPVVAMHFGIRVP
jgi:hypothetical protein